MRWFLATAFTIVAATSAVVGVRATSAASPQEVPIAMLAQPEAQCQGNAPCDWRPVYGQNGTLVSLTAFDPGSYPAGAQVTLRATLGAASPGMTACFRLAVADADASVDGAAVPVAGSDACAVQPSASVPFVVESSPLTLQPGRHFYTPQFRMDGPPQSNTGRVVVAKLELMARWTQSADTYTVTAPANAQGMATAPCDPGDVLTGGGYEGSSDPPQHVPASDSKPTGDSWTAFWRDAIGGEQAYAVCLDNPPIHDQMSVGGVAQEPNVAAVGGRDPIAFGFGALVLAIATAVAAGAWAVQRSRRVN